MLNFKTFLIAIAITFLMLAGFVNSSDALQIEEVRPYYGSNELYDWGSSAYHYVYARTDTPLLCCSLVCKRGLRWIYPWC